MKKQMLFISMSFLVLFTSLSVSGCGSKQTTLSFLPSSPEESTDKIEESLPLIPGFAGDINDIVLPTDLEWNRKESIGIKTESFRGGVYVYTGKVEIMSLKDYMVSSMRDNKWKQVGETSSKDVMLAFVKPNKTCMMVISETNGLFKKTILTFYITIDASETLSHNFSDADSTQ